MNISNVARGICRVLSVSAALSLSLAAIAEEAVEPRASEVSPQSYVLPISVIAQIEHCSEFIDGKRLAIEARSNLPKQYRSAVLHSHQKPNSGKYWSHYSEHGQH